jgi:hypothetical protein
MIKLFELGIATQVMKEQSGVEWWPHDHKEIELKHETEDHVDQELGDGQGI